MDGIYTAASVNPDGSATVMINPAECVALQSPNDSTAIPVRVCLPMKAKSATAKMGADGKESDVAVQMHQAATGSWAELVVPLSLRSVLHITPAGQ
jgi:hypothetical protein